MLTTLVLDVPAPPAVYPVVFFEIPDTSWFPVPLLPPTELICGGFEMAVIPFPKAHEIHLEIHQKAPRKATAHPVDVYLGRLGPASRRGFRIALDNIAGIISNGTKDCYELDWACLTYQETAKAREGLAAGFATRTANYGLCALRGVLKECWRLGMMTHEEFRRATDLAAVRGDNTASGRVLALEELVSLFRVCAQRDSVMGIRDAAMLAVLYSTGPAAIRTVGFRGGRLPTMAPSRFVERVPRFAWLMWSARPRRCWSGGLSWERTRGRCLSRWLKAAKRRTADWMEDRWRSFFESVHSRPKLSRLVPMT